MARLLRFAPILLGLVTASCAISNKVAAPDGSTAYDVSCFNGRWACDDEARRVCGGRPYVVLDDDTFTSVASEGKNGSVRVQCADDYAASREPAPSAPASSAAPSALVVCRAAYLEIAELARGWGTARGGVAKLEPPTEPEFLEACLPLPTRAQQCLNSIYRKEHRKTCSATLGALSDEAKGRLDDALLVQRPGAPARVPGTLEL